jgi:hypothetical protein
MAPKKKAQAPAPKVGGYDAAKERLVRASALFVVTVDGTDVEFSLPMDNMPNALLRRVRDETGHSLDWHRNNAGVETFALLWWLSRLVEGEGMEIGGRSIPLTLAQVDAEWSARCAGVAMRDINTKWVTAHDDPEGDPLGETEGQPT